MYFDMSKPQIVLQTFKNKYKTFRDKRLNHKKVDTQYQAIFVKLLLLYTARSVLTSYKASARAVLGNIGPRWWQYGPSAARSVQKRPRANIPQYGSSKLC